MLSELLAQKLASGDTAGAEALKGIALAAWGHMNLHGRFEFTTRPHPVDMAALVQQLAQHMDGVLARLAAERARTVLVCATRGEAGEIHNLDLDPEEAKERLGAIREEELRHACAVLKITERPCSGPASPSATPPITRACPRRSPRLPRARRGLIRRTGPTGRARLTPTSRPYRAGRGRGRCR